MQIVFHTSKCPSMKYNSGVKKPLFLDPSTVGLLSQILFILVERCPPRSTHQKLLRLELMVSTPTFFLTANVDNYSNKILIWSKLFYFRNCCTWISSWTPNGFNSINPVDSKNNSSSKVCSPNAFTKKQSRISKNDMV